MSLAGIHLCWKRILGVPGRTQHLNYSRALTYLLITYQSNFHKGSFHWRHIGDQCWGAYTDKTTCVMCLIPPELDDLQIRVLFQIESICGLYYILEYPSVLTA